VDLVVLVAQFFLIMLVVIVPTISAYDKWREWSIGRKLLAIALGAGTAAVLFGQYRKLIGVDRSDLPDVLSHSDKSWYVRRIVLEPWEYAASLIASSVLLALAIVAIQRGRYKNAFAYFGAFGLLIAISLAVKLRAFH
jgi:hypothetical protein